MGWKMYYNHKDTFFGSRILQIVLKTDQQLSSPFLLMVSMHILGSPSTRMQGNFSEIASCRVQKMAEASANNGSQGKIFLAQAFSNSPLSFLATTAKEEQLSETTASAFNLIIPDGGHCIWSAFFFFCFSGYCKKLLCSLILHSKLLITLYSLISWSLEWTTWFLKFQLTPMLMPSARLPEEDIVV